MGFSLFMGISSKGEFAINSSGPSICFTATIPVRGLLTRIPRARYLPMLQLRIRTGA
jgi:hypothetical protein